MNARADALSKLASTLYEHLMKKVLFGVLPEKSIDNQRVNTVLTTPEWTKPYVDYLCHDVLPDNPEEARKVKIRASHFAIRDNQLYRRGYLNPSLKCVCKTKGKTSLEDIYSWDTTVTRRSCAHMQNNLPRGILSRRVQRRRNPN